MDELVKQLVDQLTGLENHLLLSWLVWWFLDHLDPQYPLKFICFDSHWMVWMVWMVWLLREIFIWEEKTLEKAPV